MSNQLLKTLFGHATAGTLRADGFVGVFDSHSEHLEALKQLQNLNYSVDVEHVEDHFIISVEKQEDYYDNGWLNDEDPFKNVSMGKGATLWSDELDADETPTDDMYPWAGYALTPEEAQRVEQQTGYKPRANWADAFKEDPDAERVTNEAGGVQSKLTTDWKYLPWQGAREIVQNMMDNAQEYGGRYPFDNWRKISARDHLNHLTEHSISATVMMAMGEEDETLTHLVHAATRALMAIEAHLTEFN